MAKKNANGVCGNKSRKTQLRQLGVSEDAIQKLREYDWAIFNSDRRYLQKQQDTGTYLEQIAEKTSLTEIKTVEDFLDNIENEWLYQILKSLDKLTLQIIVMKIQGYSTHEIASRLDITAKAVYRRMDRFKEKIKKFLK